ncbi:hypothetical protein [Mariniblastus fucicola]|uniref:Tetratricopeptide repeat protein n=1 Tax=Mariniblastus fucicola TaxID=980251 RepID=A0A5B9PBE8_9BACT|nr:hypothetical protein [Mariniblastus fucicola]QEG20451.1 hypothetical protein MFFC18_02990 [Mariniblastus fucicola]
MRILLIVGWLFVGLGGAIFHFGPGQKHLEVDQVNLVLNDARDCVANEQWGEAVELFDAVLADLPSEKVAESRGVLLEKAKCQMMAAKLPEARSTLEGLLDDVRKDESADKHFVADVQSALANSQYYMTWLMRLEGMPEEEWKPEIEAARQHYTQLTNDAEELGDEELLKRSAEDLESAVRLARMDLSELQGLPLPSQ